MGPLIMCVDEKINDACLFLLFQGSEIFTVLARDGDQGNPNPIFYSILDGESRTTASLLHYMHLLAVLMIYHLSGSDGVFDINGTSGCITVTTYPTLLRKELYEIKVKVKTNVLYYTIYLSFLPI